MNIWNADNFSSLTPAQRRAVETRTPEGKTACEYLNEIGAGVSAVESYVEGDKQANRDALRDAADALFQAGQDPAQMVGRALRFAVSTPEVQAQVDQLLAPFAEAAQQAIAQMAPAQ